MNIAQTFPLFGPGSQPVESDTLDFVRMPQGMETYRAPILPEAGEIRDRGRAIERLSTVLDALRTVSAGSGARSCNGGASVSVALEDLGAAECELIDQALGEGEVSAIVSGPAPLRIQESVLAGVWRVRGSGVDRVDVGTFPRQALQAAFAGSTSRPQLDDGGGEPRVNAAALLAEIDEQCRAGRPARADPYVINLSLLPHTPEDLVWLSGRLGTGGLVVLSRGYGNCRITATGTRDVWWVQYFNSQDTMILNTLEVAPVPAVGCAAPEDLEDSTHRLAEILEAYL